MKKQILNLEGIAVLTKQQQKMVNGGGSNTCNCNTKNDCASGQHCANGCGGPQGGYYGNCDTGLQNPIDLTPIRP